MRSRADQSVLLYERDDLAFVYSLSNKVCHLMKSYHNLVMNKMTIKFLRFRPVQKTTFEFSLRYRAFEVE